MKGFTLNRVRKRRLLTLLVIVGFVAVAAGFTLTALNQNVMYFRSPSQIAAGDYPKNAVFRLGGIVVPGSVQRVPGSLTVHFSVTDGAASVTVQFSGILPDLFREGQGIISHGRLQGDGSFAATEVLAKHDEKYMPPEIKESLKGVLAYHEKQ